MVSPMTTFRFPRTRFVESNDLPAQLAHCGSEMVEVLEAHENHEGVYRVVEEMLDCIHSLETACRIAEEKYRLNVKDMAEQVLLKNLKRGYYS